MQMIERMMQSQENFFAQRINQATNEVIEMVGHFDGKNISKFLNISYAIWKDMD